MQNAHQSTWHKVNAQFIHSLKNYLTRARNVPGNVLGAGTIHTIDKNPYLHVAYHLLLSNLYSVLDGDDCHGEHKKGERGQGVR